jgi:N-acetylmuramoyl-L-alanine amidase
MNNKRWLILALIVVLVGTSMGAVVKRANAQTYPTAVVNTGALNIRSGPGVSYAVQTSVYRGTTLSLLARNSDASWVRVMLASGRQGWVNARYISTSYPLASLPVQGGVSGATGTVISYALNIRSGPGVGYGRVTSVYRGTGLFLQARTADGSWVKVTLPDGVTQGWVSAGYIVTTTPIMSLPVVSVTPAPAPAPGPGYVTHVVQPGENLFRIALRYGVNMYDIAQANGIINLARIYAGQVLVIPR